MRVSMVALLALPSLVDSQSPAVVEFTAVVTAEGGTADFKWTEGEDVGAAAAAFCGEHVAEEHRAACAPAIAAQVENELKVRKQLAGLPALELEVQVGEEKTVRLEPDEAYGQRRDDLVLTVPTDAFPGDTTPDVGQGVRLGLQGTVLIEKLECGDPDFYGPHPALFPTDPAVQAAKRDAVSRVLNFKADGPSDEERTALVKTYKGAEYAGVREMRELLPNIDVWQEHEELDEWFKANQDPR